MIYSPNLYPFILSHGAPTDGFPIPPSKEQVAEGLMEEIMADARKEGKTLSYTITLIDRVDSDPGNIDVDLHILCDEPTARYIEDLEHDISPATGSKLNWWRSSVDTSGMSYKLVIAGMDKQMADVMLAETPLRSTEVHHRGYWKHTKLDINGTTIGWIESSRTNDPLHIHLDLATLKRLDENWQCTLESLGVLR